MLQFFFTFFFFSFPAKRLCTTIALEQADLWWDCSSGFGTVFELLQRQGLNPAEISFV